tara:strand:- start:217 stop:462 length:246 start_codon:yes stop_codon:yes gene_type:complete
MLKAAKYIPIVFDGRRCITRMNLVFKGVIKFITRIWEFDQEATFELKSTSMVDLQPENHMKKRDIASRHSIRLALSSYLIF